MYKYTLCIWTDSCTKIVSLVWLPLPFGFPCYREFRANFVKFQFINPFKVLTVACSNNPQPSCKGLIICVFLCDLLVFMLAYKIQMVQVKHFMMCARAFLGINLNSIILLFLGRLYSLFLHRTHYLDIFMLYCFSF